MITASDSHNTIETKKYYIILPSGIKNPSQYINKFSAKKIKKSFSYNSKNNKEYLSVDQLKKIIDKEIKISDFNY